MRTGRRPPISEFALSKDIAMTILDERDVAHQGAPFCSFRADDIKNSAEFREAYARIPNTVSAEDMPFEHSPDGLIKHLVHEKMNTRESCVDAYMLFLKQGMRSGKHRHMWEEVVFVAEGSGRDLHWDLKFDCVDSYHWDWETEPKSFEWTRGDFIYIPPFSLHQHINTGEGEARLIVISNRIVKAMGFNWLDQVENAPES
jgi:quercetin dioxygenase-like cupin family protein